MSRYACLDSTNSVIGLCTSDHCQKCRFERKGRGCVLTPYDPIPVRRRPNKKAEDRRYREGKADRNRRQGKDARGNDLARTCFNCDKIRAVGVLFICGAGMFEERASKGRVSGLKLACPFWEVRLEPYVMELEEL